MSEEEFTLMVSMLELQDSIEKLRAIMEAEYHRKEGSFISAISK